MSNLEVVSELSWWVHVAVPESGVGGVYDWWGFKSVSKILDIDVELFLFCLSVHLCSVVVTFALCCG
jgi:hypothetical protein